MTPADSDLQLAGPARMPIDTAIRTLLESTVSSVGRQFFRDLVQQLSRVLGARRTFVGQTIPGQPGRMRAVAAWQEDRFVEVAEYEIATSPAAVALRDGQAEFWGNVAQHFPHTAATLAQWGVTSYSGVALRSTDGRPLGIISAMYEHTAAEPGVAQIILRWCADRAARELERMAMEAELSANRDRYRSVVEDLPDGLFIIDRGHVVFANRSGAALFGYTGPEPMVADAVEWAGHVAPAAQAHVRSLGRRVLTGGLPWADYEGRFVRLDGTVFEAEATGSRIVFGGRSCVQIIVREAGERRRFERAFAAIVRSTAGLVGEPFFRGLVAEVAGVLGVPFSFISRYEPGEPPSLRTLGAYRDGETSAGRWAPLAPDGIGQITIDHGFFHVASGAMDQFPAQRWLAQLGAQSYAAVVLTGTTGRVLGIMGVADQRPMPDASVARSILLAFAMRAAAEIERLDVEEVQREHAARLQETFDHTTDAIFVVGVGEDGSFVFEQLNRAALAATGIERVVPGLTPRSWLPPAEAVELEQQYRAALTAGRPTVVDQFLRRGADVRHWRTTLVPIADRAGRLHRLAGFARDITEEQRLTRVVAQTNAVARVGGWEIDVPTQVQRWTDETFRLFGLVPSPQAPSIPEMLTRFAVADREALERAVKAAIATGESFDLMVEVCAEDGRLRRCRCAGAVERREGRTMRIYGALQDLTALREAEAARAQSERRLLDVLERMDLLAVGLDQDGRIIYANETTARATGVPRGELLGQDWFASFVPPEQREARFATFGAILRGKDASSVQENEVVIQGERRRIRWSVIVTAGLGDDAGSVMSLGDDVTDLRRAEQEIRHLNGELERRVADRTAQLAAANAELEAFSYSVSHDLRSPLRALDGFSRALEEDYGNVLEGEGIDYLHRIRAASQRMGLLIDDLIRLSRASRQEMHRQCLDLVPYAREIEAELRQRESGRAVEFTCAEELLLEADPALARIVLQNLLENAWKYTRRQPAARIEFGRLAEPDGTGAAVLFVRDNGAGFDPRYAHKLFSAFQRLHNPADFEGTGIGLATVRRICARHGGRAWAEGAIDQGACVYFTFSGFSTS